MILDRQIRIDAGVDTFFALRCVSDYLSKGLDRCSPYNLCIFASKDDDDDFNIAIYSTDKNIIVRDNRPRKDMNENV
jgi:hypothetical protein